MYNAKAVIVGIIIFAGIFSAPFWVNFNGTRDDVETVTHEAGHAFAAWLNRKRVPLSNVWPSLEACEVHSMSISLISHPCGRSSSHLYHQKS